MYLFKTNGSIFIKKKKDYNTFNAYVVATCPVVSQTCKCIMERTQNTVLVEKHATSLWGSQLPLKQRVSLWRCLLCLLPIGSNLQKRSIASPHCARCVGRLETMTLTVGLGYYRRNHACNLQEFFLKYFNFYIQCF